MSKIIEIEELRFPKSLIIRYGALVSELIDTKDLVNELNEQLRQYNVRRSFFAEDLIIEVFKEYGLDTLVLDEKLIESLAEDIFTIIAENGFIK